MELCFAFLLFTCLVQESALVEDEIPATNQHWQQTRTNKQILGVPLTSSKETQSQPRNSVLSRLDIELNWGKPIARFAIALINWASVRSRHISPRLLSSYNNNDNSTHNYLIIIDHWAWWATKKGNWRKKRRIVLKRYYKSQLKPNMMGYERHE